MRRYYMGLLLLLQTLASSNAEGTQKVLANSKPNGQKNGDQLHADIATAQAGERLAQDGDSFVAEALSLLRSLHQPSRDRIRKQQGLTATLLNLALKAVPTIRLSEPQAAESSSPKANTLSRGLQEATALLETAAARNNSDAIYLLAELSFYGNYSYPRDFKAAFEYYHKLAELNGNSSAQYMVGLMYSTGVGGAVEPDQARALLYYTFAANQGHTRAEMSLAHRHQAGIATPKSCEMAAKYYKRVADKAMAWYRSGPPGGMGWIPESYRIADESGGVYGEGASVSSAGINAIKAHPNSDAYASIEDIIEYLNLMSEKGDFKASFNLGRIFYDGQRGLPKDMGLARKFFFDVAQKYWVKGRPIQNPKPGLDKIAAKAAGFLGRMFMRGEGAEQNFDRAKFWFERGALLKDAQSQFGLGLLHLHGYGVKRDVAEASSYFKAAAAQDFSHAQVQLGALYLDQGGTEDIISASHYFELAARWSNLESYYHLAELNYFGVGREKSCSSALGYFKNVAERAEPFVSSWAEANAAYEEGDTELAVLEYIGAAEQGYEKAQNNVAHLLDPDQSRLPIPDWLFKPAKRPELLDNPRLALMYWTRSARQGNVDALVKMGDYYLYGLGAEADVDKAVQCYQGASEYQQSAQAMYNLGWMYENGVGLDQDFHLAKRHYDSALEINEEAYLPVALSLLKLRARSAWNTLTHGRVNSIRDEPVEKKQWSLSEWINNFLQDDGQGYYDEYLDEYYDDATMPGGDGPDFGGGAGGGAVGDDDEDGLVESLVIIGLVSALAFLLVYRNQRQQEARRRQEQELLQQQQEDANRLGGQQAAQPPRFPEPGDPNFWNPGGMLGH
ncbi:protein sel-1 1 [Cladorrhinum samala]|uniref:Protein sel-1 1 n=1 Tax=Cladorrhinum samala TaxID=585594 RepID=A0AAV9H6N4_9PEZI|nr:protein sel-1 1 [Cladorrhinum samala]